MWKFIKSSSAKDNWLEHNQKEICIIGRSNVGKSSLINALAKNNKLAKTSKTPGRTQLINYFQLPNNTIVVDLPGFGFANISYKKQEEMFQMVDEYFKQSKPLVVLFLIDSRRGIMEQDSNIIDHLLKIGHNIVFILTKTDKAKQKEIANCLKNSILKEHKYFLSSTNEENKISKIRDFIFNL